MGWVWATITKNFALTSSIYQKQGKESEETGPLAKRFWDPCDVFPLESKLCKEAKEVVRELGR